MNISSMYNMHTQPVINRDQEIFNDVKNAKSGKEQLKKIANEFESIFITKMLTLMDKTVEKEGLFGEKNQYTDTFKSIVFQEMGRDLSKNERTSFGFAKQIYEQMERYVQD